MPTKTETAGKLLLQHRTARLLRLLELNAPDLLLANEAVLIFRAACLLAPTLAGKALAEGLRDLYAYEKHICLNCFDAPWAGDIGLCEKCEAEMKAEDKDVAHFVDTNTKVH